MCTGAHFEKYSSNYTLLVEVSKKNFKDDEVSNYAFSLGFTTIFLKSKSMHKNESQLLMYILELIKSNDKD